MVVERRVVDNRVFLLGLDELYRYAMKNQERGELLTCARRVAEALHTPPADVPIEGYYSEESELTEYFRLLRALQQVEETSTPAVASLPEFQRLLDVVSSSLFGQPQQDDKLLPAGRDALSHALSDTSPADWSIETLVTKARAAAQKMDDYSLVGLAARAQDAVVLAALRESVVVYAEMIFGAAGPPQTPEYVWKVDKDLAAHAQRFVETFNKLFDHELPTPEPKNAQIYWDASWFNGIIGRCARLGIDQPTPPQRHYHWAIFRNADGEYAVQEFWKSEVWTTDRYRSATGQSGRPLNL